MYSDNCRYKQRKVRIPVSPRLPGNKRFPKGIYLCELSLNGYDAWIRNPDTKEVLWEGKWKRLAFWIQRKQGVPTQDESKLEWIVEIKH